MGEREFRTLEEYCTHYGGLEEKECGSGGNCFYHCLAAAENMDYWIYVQNIEQNGPDNLRQAMQMQMRWKVQAWLQSKDGHIAGNRKTLLELLLDSGSSNLYDSLLNSASSMQFLSDALVKDMEDPAYFEGYLQSLEDPSTRDELRMLSLQIIAAPFLADPLEAEHRAEMVGLMLPMQLHAGAARCPSHNVGAMVWVLFLGFVVTEGEWNEDVCLVAAAAHLKKPINVIMADHERKLLSRFPQTIMPPAEQGGRQRPKSMIHLLNVSGTHWKLLWPSEIVLDDEAGASPANFVQASSMQRLAELTARVKPENSPARRLWSPAAPPTRLRNIAPHMTLKAVSSMPRLPDDKGLNPAFSQSQAPPTSTASRLGLQLPRHPNSHRGLRTASPATAAQPRVEPPATQVVGHKRAVEEVAEAASKQEEQMLASLRQAITSLKDWRVAPEVLEQLELLLAQKTISGTGTYKRQSVELPANNLWHNRLEAITKSLEASLVHLHDAKDMLDIVKDMAADV